LLYSYFCSPSIFFPNASICISWIYIKWLYMEL
jgi:hypothetical protein